MLRHRIHYNHRHFGLITILLIALSCSVACGQDATFTATVDKNILEMGERLEVTFTLNGAKGGANFRAPAFNDFVMLSGPNQMTNTQFINGVISVSASYTYVLQPKSEGKFTIGPATITVDGKQLQTQPIGIEVRKGSAQQRQQSQGSQQQTDVARQIGDNIYLRVAVDRGKVYQGEQVTASYKLYWRISLASNPSITKAPALSGFWNEEIEMPRQGEVTREVVNGKQYNVATLKKVALFPQRSGNLTIDPMEIDCQVQVQSRRRSNDIFDQIFNDPFFGNVSNVNHKVRSQPVTVNVIPLPTADQPAEFSGAVGSFSIESWLDKREVKANEPVVLKVKITGRGNIKLLAAPTITTSSDIERYDPKIYDNIAKQGDRIAGSRTFEYLMIPRHPGEQKIPSFVFSYFDVDKKQYSTYRSPDFIVAVDKGDEITQSYASGINKEDVKLLGEDIRFIKSETTTLHRKGESFAGSALFFIMSVIPVLGFIGLIIVMRKREKLYGNTMLVRNRKARKIARRRLQEAHKLLQQKKNEEFYTELSRALYGYMSDKMSIPQADITIDKVCSALRERNIPEEKVERLAKVIEDCEFARFAPSVDTQKMDTMYSEASDLISSLENQL
jgi:hypothetical protein